MTQPEALRLAAWAEEHMPFDYEKQAIVDTLRRQHAEIERLRRALKLCAAVCAGESLNKNSLVNALEAARAALDQT